MEVKTVTSTEYSDVVELACVCGKPRANGEGYEDSTFARYTPSGSMKLQIDNPALRGVVKPGQVFYVDLIPVPPAEPAKA